MVGDLIAEDLSIRNHTKALGQWELLQDSNFAITGLEYLGPSYEDLN